MIQRKTIDLRAHRFSESGLERLEWHPTSQMYLTRVLIALGLCLLTGFLWVAAGATSWQKDKRLKRQAISDQRRSENEQRLAESMQRLEQAMADNPMWQKAKQKIKGKGKDQIVEVSDNQHSLEQHAQERAPLALRAATVVLLLCAIWLPLSTLWHRVTVFRQRDRSIWIRYWFGWPRKRILAESENARLILWALQHHRYYKRRYLGSRWYWVAQIRSDIIPLIPIVGGSVLAIGWRSTAPDLLLLDQDVAPQPGQGPPRDVRVLCETIAKRLGIPWEAPRVVAQECSFDSWGSPARSSRYSSEVLIPLQQEVEAIDLSSKSKAEVQALMKSMMKEGQVTRAPDGTITISTSKTTSQQEVPIEKLEGLLASVPPEIRQQILNKGKKSR